MAIYIKSMHNLGAAILRGTQHGDSSMLKTP